MVSGQQTLQPLHFHSPTKLSQFAVCPTTDCVPNTNALTVRPSTELIRKAFANQPHFYWDAFPSIYKMCNIKQNIQLIHLFRSHSNITLRRTLIELKSIRRNDLNSSVKYCK